MAVKFNKAAFDRAVYLIKNKLEVDSGNWDEVKPNSNEVQLYIDAHSMDEYGQWFLGIDGDKDPKDKSKYVFPWGDLRVLQTKALQAAANAPHPEIKDAAQKLLQMIQNNK